MRLIRAGGIGRSYRQGFSDAVWRGEHMLLALQHDTEIEEGFCETNHMRDKPSEPYSMRVSE
jgi:hypothetical protein